MSACLSAVDGQVGRLAAVPLWWRLVAKWAEESRDPYLGLDSVAHVERKLSYLELVVIVRLTAMMFTAENTEVFFQHMPGGSRP